MAGHRRALGRNASIAALVFCIGVVWAGARPAHADPALNQQVYIWQRHWSPAMSQVMTALAPQIDGWRVLAGEADGPGPMRRIEPDWAALIASNKPVTLVIRLESRGGRWASPLDNPALPAALTTVLTDWRSHGVTPGALELDYDSPTSRLAGYADFLRRLRPHLPERTPLSITGLPDWLNSPDLDEVLAQVDEFTLQVHGLAPSQDGLFDAHHALEWLDRLARRSPKPIRLALPTYGVAVTKGADGKITHVESEPLSLGGAGQNRRILFTPPQEIAATLQTIKQHPPAHLTGVSWFRLPLPGDRHNWSLETLQAVLNHSPLTERIEAEATLLDNPAGVTALALINNGDTDVALPRRILLPAACSVLDGQGGYRRDPSGPLAPTLHHPAPGLLRAHQKTKVGWARCILEKKDVRLEP